MSRYFTNFAGSILIKGTRAGDPQKLQKHFPEFLWLLRDVELDMVDNEDGETELTPTEYVTKCVFQRGKSAPDNSSNDIGSQILKMFPNFTCLKISCPQHEAEELLDYDDESSDFNKDIQLAIDHIKEQVKVKRGFEGHGTVDGPSLAILAEQFVDALNTPGRFPDLERGWNAVVEQHLITTVEHCVAEYSKELRSKIHGKLPIEEERLMNIHEIVLESKLECLQNKIQALIPGQRAVDTKQYRTHASKLTTLVVKYDTKSSQAVVGGELYQFVVENEKESRMQCKLLSQELRNTNLALPDLIGLYKRKSVGPAKDEVYQQDISVIPGKPERLLMKENSHNMIEISWRKPTVHRDCEKEYHGERCLDIPNDKWSQTQTTQILSMRFNHLKPVTDYRFRVCAINNTNKSEYSIIDVSTTAGPPNTPEKPKLEVVGCYSGTLTCRAPKEDDGNGSPINKMIVEMYINGVKVLQQGFELCLNNAEYITQKVPLPSAKDDETVHIRLRWENMVGVSSDSDPFLLPMVDMIPGPPTNFRTVGRTHKIIKVRYDPPEINPNAVATYVIKIQKKTDGFELLKQTTKCSAVAKKLKPDTPYIFHVGALNRNQQFCEYVLTLSCETKLSVLGSGLAKAGGATVGAVASPITGAAIVPAASVVSLQDGIKDKSAGKIIGGTIGLLSTPITAPLGFLAGLIASPIGAAGGGLAVHLLYKDSDDDLEDSDDDHD